MASHLSTPKSILNAPKGTRRIVPGTEFTGRNRAARRKVWRAPSPTAYSQRVQALAYGVIERPQPGAHRLKVRQRIAARLRRLGGDA